MRNPRALGALQRGAPRTPTLSPLGRGRAPVGAAARVPRDRGADRPLLPAGATVPAGRRRASSARSWGLSPAPPSFFPNALRMNPFPTCQGADAAGISLTPIRRCPHRLLELAGAAPEESVNGPESLRSS